jgi:adenylate cyclase
MGDGVLAEFASAVNAVRCAADLQQQMSNANVDIPDDRQVLLRIGINLGDVVVEGSDLYGEGVNIAARLEAIAEHG